LAWYATTTSSSGGRLYKKILLENFYLKKLFTLAGKASRTEFVKVSSWSAASTLVKMITGMVSTKVAAWTIGTAGMGVVGNFLNSINIISVLGTGGIGQGVTKYIAEHYDQPEKQNQVIAQAARVTLFSSLLVSLLVILFSTAYGQYVFKTNQYNSIIIYFGCSIFLYAFNFLFINILNGFKQYRKFVKVNIATSIGSLIVSVLLVLNFGLYGALLSAIVSQSIIILITLFFIYKEKWFQSLFSKESINWPVIRMLGAFTVMTLVSTFMIQFAQLSVRSDIAARLSPHAAGIWESMNRVSSMYLMVVTTSISTFYLPRLAEIKENYVLRQEILKTAKIVLPVLFVCCFSIFVLRDVIIWVLFTREFSEVRNLFAFQMIGDFLKIASWLVAFLFWAKAMTKTFLFTEIAFNITWILFARWGVQQFGLEGSVYAYALNYLLYLLVILFIFRNLLFTRAGKQLA
jgi:O-antigen/teichoic acid export membrane protein